MRLLRAVLLLGFSAAVALLPAVPPGAEPAVTLTASITTQTARLLHVAFKGTATLPDRSVLGFRILHREEEDRRGALEPAFLSEGTGTLEPLGGSFAFDQRLRVPGLYRVELDLRNGQVPARRWEFEFAVWDDELMPRLLAEMAAIERLTLRLVGLCVRMNVAVQSRKEWTRKPLSFLLEMQQAQTVLDQDFALLFPAAGRSLRRALGVLKAAPHHFLWKPDGTFGGAFDETSGTWIQAPCGASFSFERMINCLEDAYQTGRRELALWVVNEARRSGRRRAPPPELARLLEGLEAGHDLDALEMRIRRNAPAGKPAPEPSFSALRRDRVEEASVLLRAADLKWDEMGDQTAPGLYRQLLQDFPREVERLGVRARVANRAKSE